MSNYKYIFGPVNSRRLGISLGVDLVPHKVCTINCIYCECGQTTNLTNQRKEYVPLKDVLFELNDYLKNNPKLDYITFSGSGEPTLHNGIGKVIEFIKNSYPGYKISVLTNSTLLHQKDVRNELINADIIIPSLDAVSEDIFKKINRPLSEISVSAIINGIKALRKQFSGKLIIEVFLVAGLNTKNEELQKLKDVLLDISPDAVQLNTLDRPGTEDWIKPVNKDELINIRNFMQPLIVQLFSLNNKKSSINDHDFDIETYILSLIKRRPCTLDDLSFSLGLNKADLEKIINNLLKSDKIIEIVQKRGLFYALKGCK